MLFLPNPSNAFLFHQCKVRAVAMGIRIQTLITKLQHKTFILAHATKHYTRTQRTIFSCYYQITMSKLFLLWYHINKPAKKLMKPSLKYLKIRISVIFLNNDIGNNYTHSLPLQFVTTTKYSRVCFVYNSSRLNC